MNGTLTQPMEEWYQGRLMQIWNQVYSPMTKCIYSFEQGSVQEYAKHHLLQSRFTYSRHLTTTSFPRDSVPITGRFESGHFVPDSRQQPTFTPPQTLPDDTATKMIRTIQGMEFHYQLTRSRMPFGPEMPSFAQMDRSVTTMAPMD